MSPVAGASNPIDISRLTEAQATLLMPLWARACESRQPQPLLRDAKAEEIVSRLDFDFGRFERQNVSSLDYCIRAAVIDQMVAEFIAQHAEATVVEIGAGLDTRFDRLDNGRVTWIELDLPEVMKVRKRFFEESARRIMLADSLLNDTWLEQVAARQPGPLLFVAEGVFYFFERADIQRVLSGLADRFPNSGIVFDAQSPLFLRVSQWRHPMRDARLLFSVGNPSQITGWDARFQLRRVVGFGDRPYYDKCLKRVSTLRRWGRRLFPPVRQLFKIIHLVW